MTLVPHDDLETAVAAQQLNLQQVMDRLAQRENPPALLAAAPKVQKVVAISPSQKKALRSLPAKIAAQELPPEPRQLTDEEKAAWIPLFDEIKDAKSALLAAEEAFKQVFHNHLDVEAKSVSNGGLEFDPHGHVAQRGEVIAEGVAKKVVRDLRGGDAAPLTLPDLEALEKKGYIDHAQFIAMTTAVPATRRPDPVKIMSVLSENTKLIKALGKVAKLNAKTTAIRVAKND